MVVPSLYKLVENPMKPIVGGSFKIGFNAQCATDSPTTAS